MLLLNHIAGFPDEPANASFQFFHGSGYNYIHFGQVFLQVVYIF